MKTNSIHMRVQAFWLITTNYMPTEKYSTRPVSISLPAFLFTHLQFVQHAEHIFFDRNRQKNRSQFIVLFLFSWPFIKNSEQRNEMKEKK